MIVCHPYRFIFIKTRKTAGTSIHIGLSRFCGPADVIAPVSEIDDEIRRELGYPAPQNYYVPYSRYGLKDWGRLVVKGKQAEFVKHMPAKDIRAAVGKAVWNSYFKFCFERNPWDKAISLYYWRTRNWKERPSLYEYILANRKNGVSNFDLYTIDGKVAVDYVARYEDLEQELDTLTEKLGLPERITLPQAKGAYRADRRPYQETLTEKERDEISAICAREIGLLGYRY